MTIDTVKIKCETEGFEEATEKVATLLEAMKCFPPQVTLHGCKDCSIEIHPSQTMIIDSKPRGGEES